MDSEQTPKYQATVWRLVAGGIVIHTRLMATAFLSHADRLLLMRRSPKATLFPGKWAPIGGHLEAEEINDPQAACLREFQEETGLTGAHLVNLSLRYIVHRQRGDEIRTQYVYFGSVTEERFGKSDEGELCWVPFDRVADLDMSDTTRFTLEHYMAHGSQTDCVYVGTVGVRRGRPVISWAALRDWE